MTASAQRGGRPVRSILIRIVVALVALGAVVFLFLRTIRNADSDPYTVRRDDLRQWTVLVNETPDPRGALLVLRPQPELQMHVSQQVFRRRMESLTSPSTTEVPLILTSEFEQAFKGIASPADLARVAEQAGVATESPTPVCLASTRGEGPSARGEIFFLLFEAPRFERFRQEAAALLEARRGDRSAFDPSALSPLLFLSASDRNYQASMPRRLDPARDCVAPVTLE